MKREPFIILPRKIFDYQLPPIAFAVYCYLLCCHNKTNGCYPCRQTISKACGISDSSVGRAIKQLEKRGAYQGEAQLRRRTPAEQFL